MRPKGSSTSSSPFLHVLEDLVLHDEEPAIDPRRLGLGVAYGTDPAVLLDVHRVKADIGFDGEEGGDVVVPLSELDHPVEVESVRPSV